MGTSHSTIAAGPTATSAHDAFGNDRADPTGLQQHLRVVAALWSDVMQRDLLGIGCAVYRAVFLQHPSWRLTLFGGVDPMEQPQLLMEMMGRAVESFLGHLHQQVDPAPCGAGQQRLQEASAADAMAHSDRYLHGLGERHAGYGVTEKDYTALGKCFLTTLATTLGPARFGPLQREAFTRLWGFVSRHMYAGQRGARGIFFAKRWAERLNHTDLLCLDKAWRTLFTRMGVTKRDLLLGLRARVLCPGQQQQQPYLSVQCTTPYDAELAKFIAIVEQMSTLVVVPAAEPAPSSPMQDRHLFPGEAEGAEAVGETSAATAAAIRNEALLGDDSAFQAHTRRTFTFCGRVESTVADFFVCAGQLHQQQQASPRSPVAGGGADSEPFTPTTLDTCAAVQRFAMYAQAMVALLVQLVPGDEVLHDTWHRRFSSLVELALKRAEEEDYQI